MKMTDFPVEEFRKELTGDILPFWMNRMIDPAGGFYGRMDGEGHIVPGSPKGAVLNSRILWTFAAAYGLTQDSRYLQTAIRARDEILQKFIDPEYGGVYWSLDAQGRPADTKKQFYAIAFAIYGLSELYRATKDPASLKAAEDLFHCIEEHSFDPVNGGYLEACTRDWGPIGDMRLSAKDQNDAKTMNTHLHILEGYTALYGVWKDPLLEKRLRELVDLFLGRIIRDSSHLGLFFDENWNLQSTAISPGHDIEASWLLCEAAQALADEALLARVEKACIGLAAGALEHNLVSGEWWEYAEMVTGSFNLYQLTGDRIILDEAAAAWKYIKKRLIAPDGEWYWSVREDGTPNTEDDRAGFWKCPYHNSRMCIEIIRRCAQFDKYNYYLAIMYSLGIDIGSSSVKVSLLDIKSGKCVKSSTNPSSEAPISSPEKGWAEQDPEMWWGFVRDGIAALAAEFSMKDVACIGVTYQMHGLVAVDKEVRPVRDSIIWCDSRAVGLGAEALEKIGYDKCMSHLLNSPGNFTASKLAWVKRNEPEKYARVWKFILPGDYIVYKLSGSVATTETGLSEQILWDFKEARRADFVADYYGFDPSLAPDIAPSIGIAARTDAAAQQLLGIPEGTPISYRAGDQPNNAFSLNVLNPGEVAATGGTSGVVYGVTDVPKADPQSRVNTFLHVNNTAAAPRLGILLCINGTGILNSWIRRNVTPDLGYAEMNDLAATAPAGCDGLTVLPFGNGAERVLGNKSVGAQFAGLDLVRHTRAHMLRAAQEGIAFSFRYGIDIMKNLGLDLRIIRAGKANLFLSPLFRETLATLCGADIELYDTDGALGAARGAALGAGFYASPEEAFATLTKLDVVHPRAEWAAALDAAYENWKKSLNNTL